MFGAYAEFQILLYDSKSTILERDLASFTPTMHIFLLSLTWASHSSALMHSVGTHVEYTCKTKHRIALSTFEGHFYIVKYKLMIRQDDEIYLLSYEFKYIYLCAFQNIMCAMLI